MAKAKEEAAAQTEKVAADAAKDVAALQRVRWLLPPLGCALLVPLRQRAAWCKRLSVSAAALTLTFAPSSPPSTPTNQPQELAEQRGVIATLRGELECATDCATRSEEAVATAAAAATNGAASKKSAAGPSPEPQLVPKPTLK